MNTFKTPKGTELPLMDLKGKPYLQVPWRVLWFREEHPDWVIETDYPILNDHMAVARAKIFDSTGKLRAMGHKVEHAKHFADYCEKAETGSIGRALALIGFGTQFAVDLEEGERIADAPLERTMNTMPTRQINPGEVIVPFGKDKGKKIKDIPDHMIADSINYWKERLQKEGKNPTGQLADFLSAAESYIARPMEDIPL